MLVGIVVDRWEREAMCGFAGVFRTRYINCDMSESNAVDDGTAIVECTHRSKDPNAVKLPWVGDTIRVIGKVYVRRRGTEKERQLELENGAWRTSPPRLSSSPNVFRGHNGQHRSAAHPQCRASAQSAVQPPVRRPHRPRCSPASTAICNVKSTINADPTKPASYTRHVLARDRQGGSYSPASCV